MFSRLAGGALRAAVSLAAVPAFAVFLTAPVLQARTMASSASVDSLIPVRAHAQTARCADCLIHVLCCLLQAWKRVAGATCAIACGSAVAMTVLEGDAVSASDVELHATSYPWSHSGHLQTLDHARFVLLLLT